MAETGAVTAEPVVDCESNVAVEIPQALYAHTKREYWVLQIRPVSVFAVAVLISVAVE